MAKWCFTRTIYSMCSYIIFVWLSETKIIASHCRCAVSPPIRLNIAYSYCMNMNMNMKTTSQEFFDRLYNCTDVYHKNCAIRFVQHHIELQFQFELNKNENGHVLICFGRHITELSLFELDLSSHFFVGLLLSINAIDLIHHVKIRLAKWNHIVR